MSSHPRRDVFHAIADPTRRQIIGLLAKKRLNLNNIAENFDISRPAISQQIKILTECGLIVIRQEGRQRYCEAKLDTLTEVSGWIDQYKKLWEARMDKLGSVLSDMQKTNKRKPAKKKQWHRKL